MKAALTAPSEWYEWAETAGVGRTSFNSLSHIIIPGLSSSRTSFSAAFKAELQAWVKEGGTLFITGSTNTGSMLRDYFGLAVGSTGCDGGAWGFNKEFNWLPGELPDLLEATSRQLEFCIPVADRSNQIYDDAGGHTPFALHNVGSGRVIVSAAAPSVTDSSSTWQSVVGVLSDLSPRTFPPSEYASYAQCGGSCCCLFELID